MPEGLTEEMADHLALYTAFDEYEIRQLWRLFYNADTDSSGSISESELLAMSHLSFNPLSERVVKYAFESRQQRREELERQRAVLGSMGKGLAIGACSSAEMESGDDAAATTELSFSDFVHVLSPLAPSASLEEKVRLAFAVFDFDGDGKLSESDLRHMIRHTLGEAIDDDLLEEVVEKTFIEADKDEDGFLSMREFKHAIDKDNFRARLTLQLD